jgi:hypothetical protein
VTFHEDMLPYAKLQVVLHLWAQRFLIGELPAAATFNAGGHDGATMAGEVLRAGKDDKDTKQK